VTRFYFSASNEAEFRTLRKERVEHILLSLAYWKNKLDRIPPGPRLILDSGAYTNSLASRKVKLTLEDFCLWVKNDCVKCKAKIDFVFMFDDIASREGTMKNWDELCKRGIKSVFVDHIRYFHLNRDVADKIWKDYGRVAISLPDTAVQRARRIGAKGFMPMPEVLKRMEQAWALRKSLGTKIHLLAVIKPSVLQKFTPDTLDTASWLNGSQYGNVFVYEVTDVGKVRGIWTNIHTPRFESLLRTMVRRQGLDHKNAVDRDRFNVRSLLTFERFLAGDKTALRTIRKDFTLNDSPDIPDSDIPGLLPLWAGPSVPLLDGGSVAKSEWPALKTPDPAYLIRRLKSGVVAGVLSAVDRGSRVGVEQALVNERIKAGEPTKAWAIVAMGEPKQVDSLKQLSSAQREGVDDITRREFEARESDGETPFLFYPLKLVRVLDPPKTLDDAPEGRRFASPIELRGRGDAQALVALAIPEKLRQMPTESLGALDDDLHEIFEEHFAGSDTTRGDGFTREDIVNAHAFLVTELNSRDLKHDPDDALTKETLALRKRDTAPVHPSGEQKDGPAIALKDVLDTYRKPIVLARGVATLTGSVCNQGTSRNDVDIIVRDSALSPSLQEVLRFRLGRAADPGLSERLSFHPDEDFPSGRFTDHVELYDLVAVPRPDPAVIRMRAEKQDDPLLDTPRPGKRPAVAQLHFRGQSVHLDLRFAVDDREKSGFLVGWTVANQKTGTIDAPVDTEAEAARVWAGWDRTRGNRFLKAMEAGTARNFAEPKLRQPLAWLRFSGRVDPGEVGATRNMPGYLFIAESTAKTGLHVEWGVQEPHYHEYFLTGGSAPHELAGTLIFRQLVSDDDDVEKRETPGPDEGTGRVPGGRAFWVSAFAKNALPSILRARSVERGRMPPKGRSWLPEALERLVPEEFRYWKADDPKRAREIRDALVKSGFFTEENVTVVGGEYRRGVEKAERHAGESVSECAARKIPILIREGMPHERAVAAAFAMCSETTDKSVAKSDPLPASKPRWVRVFKLDRAKEERFVLGVVLEPETEDSQGDVYSEEEVRQACHNFMEDARQIGLMHRELIRQGVAILENYLSPSDAEIDGQKIKKGTWMLGLRISDDELWGKVKRGELTGFSIGGSAVRAPERAQAENRN
jgi:hypothetical protein